MDLSFLSAVNNKLQVTHYNQQQTSFWEFPLTTIVFVFTDNFDVQLQLDNLRSTLQKHRDFSAKFNRLYHNFFPDKPARFPYDTFTFPNLATLKVV